MCEYFSVDVWLRKTCVLCSLDYVVYCSCQLNPHIHYKVKDQDEKQKKTHICFENTPRRIPEILLWQVLNIASLLTFLTSWPWPLTYDLDLKTWPRYPSTWPPCQNSSPYVCPFGSESGNRHTHRRCQNYYTQHVTDVGSKKTPVISWISFMFIYIVYRLQ